MTKPVIFLDIDGVLVTSESVKLGTHCMDKLCVLVLDVLVRETDADIVITSSWRIGLSLDFIRGALACAGFTNWRRVIDATKHMHYRSDGGVIVATATRADEIREWLARNPRERYVILDDDHDAEIAGHFVRTDADFGGLTMARHFHRARQILKPEIATLDPVVA